MTTFLSNAGAILFPLLRQELKLIDIIKLGLTFDDAQEIMRKFPSAINPTLRGVATNLPSKEKS